MGLGQVAFSESTEAEGSFSISSSPRHRHPVYVVPSVAGGSTYQRNTTTNGGSYQKMTPSSFTSGNTTTNNSSNSSLLPPLPPSLSSSNKSRIRRHISNSTNRQFSPWIRKPLWAIKTQDEHHDHDLAHMFSNDEDNSNGNNTSSLCRSSLGNRNNDHDMPVTPTTTNNSNQLHRHLTLFDLVCVGVGGTIGSGIFVLCGLIARNYAGPATFVSWGIAGIAATLSGCCFAELAGRIPSSGSSYAYTFISMGELPAFLSAGCLTLEYLFSGSAVARSWGDKVVEWFQVDGEGEDNNNDDNSSSSSFILSLIDPGYGINPMAFLVSAISTALLYQGVKESKSVTNFFSTVKVGLVIFMTVGGFMLYNPINVQPLVPSQFGISGIFRGATSSFFGYIGYDEVCCLAGEAINPRRTMPRAVMLVIAFVTVLYMTAALALVGMQPYDQISEASGFPVAFGYNDIVWASNISALGELLTLPIVVLITLMAQPRLQYALAEDGLLPPWFGEVDARGNLRNSTLAAGIVMTMVATFVPFTYLNDLISAGILIAFSMTDCSVVLLRLSSPSSLSSSSSLSRSSSFGQTHGGDCHHDPSSSSSSFLLEKLMLLFNVQCFLTSLAIDQFWEDAFGRCIIFVFVATTIGNVGYIHHKCPPRAVFGGGAEDSSTSTTDDSSGNSSNPNLQQQQSSKDHFFQTPLVPYVPCLGIFVNWYLIAQLESSGLWLLLGYLLFWIFIYFLYGAKHSYGNTRGWDIQDMNHYNHSSSSNNAAPTHQEQQQQQPPYTYTMVHPSGSSTVDGAGGRADGDDHNDDILYGGPNEPMLLRTISLPKRGESTASTTTNTTS